MNGRKGPTTPPASEALRLDGVRKVYGADGNRVVALDGVSLSLPAGSFTAVMGPSGSGKCAPCARARARSPRASWRCSSARS
ncbi:ABC-type antimicrobial peptide transport system%2C ATPase component [Mycobacterium tuberculosis]|nr:ABC-type antimicrobial peptide transport system%2C ATPase component [Mycobacterium tuberculosis]